MLKEVENKINELHTAQKEEYYKQKEIDLENWGLSQRRNKNSAVPIIVTDEEYEALIDASIGTRTSGRNTISSLLNGVAVAIVALGIVIGVACAILLDDLGAVYFSVSIVSGLLLALLFRGVAEAITILQQLLDMKRAEEFKKAHQKSRVFPDTQPQTNQAFSNAPPVHYAYPQSAPTINMPK